MSKKFIPEYLLLSFILLLGLVLRFYKIDIPLADHHSWRQADTAAVARNFIKEGYDFLHPRIDNMTALHSPDLPNPNRYFFVEPPIYQSVVFLFYQFFGVNILWARLVSVLFSLGSIIFLFLLVSRLASRRIGLLAAFFLAVLPYSVFYSRVVLPEPLMIFTSLAMFYFFILWLEKQDSWWRFLLTVGFALLAFSLKSFPLFLVVPLFFLVWQKFGRDFWKVKKLYLLAALAVVPILLWRLWISSFPEGTPPFDWLFNQGNIRFKGAFFYWIFAKRIGELILGFWGLPLLVLGLVIKPGRKESWFFHFWLLAFLLYVTVFAAGNVTHDYYQIPFVPIAAIFLAKGVDFLLFSAKDLLNRYLSSVLTGVCLILALAFSWYEVRGFYFIQGGVDLAGQAVDELTPKDALVLAGDSNDATLLYNTNRWGWTGGYASYFPNNPQSIEKAKSLGADYFVTTKVNEIRNSDFDRYLRENYQVVKETNQFVLFDLK